MRKRILLTIVLLLSAAWLAAQQNAPQGALPGNQTTVEGCLSGSDGNYTLTDKSGNTYQLSGDNSMLRDHVGHDVQVTGNMAPSTASSTAGGAGSNQQIINVASLKHISSTCGTSR